MIRTGNTLDRTDFKTGTVSVSPDDARSFSDKPRAEFQCRAFPLSIFVAEVRKQETTPHDVSPCTRLQFAPTLNGRVIRCGPCVLALCTVAMYTFTTIWDEEISSNFRRRIHSINKSNLFASNHQHRYQHEQRERGKHNDRIYIIHPYREQDKKQELVIEKLISKIKYRVEMLQLQLRWQTLP